MKILVIGAQNIDIFASLPHNYLLGDSNVSKISYAFGGVGRNIAVNLNSLGNEVHFLTVFGDDFMSKAAMQRLRELEIDITESRLVENSPNSTYLAVLDEDNDLHLGMNSMRIVRGLDIEYIKAKHDYIQTFDYIAIDNNLTRDVIKHIIKTYKQKTIFMDAVSAKKVSKLERLLPYIDYLKLNVMELCKLTNETNAENALLSPLLEHSNTLVVTNKEYDIAVKTQRKTSYYKPLQIQDIVNTSGAGDAFMSGFIHGVLHGKDQETQITYALRLAQLTLHHEASAKEILTKEEVSYIHE